METRRSLESLKAEIRGEVEALVKLSRLHLPPDRAPFEPDRKFDLRNPFDGELYTLLERGAWQLVQCAAKEAVRRRKGASILSPSDRLAITKEIFPFLRDLWLDTGYDIARPLRQMELGGKPTLDHLRKTLDSALMDFSWRPEPAESEGQTLAGQQPVFPTAPPVEAEGMLAQPKQPTAAVRGRAETATSHEALPTASEQRECEGTPPGATAPPESQIGDAPELAANADSASSGMATNDPHGAVPAHLGPQAVKEPGSPDNPGTADVIKAPARSGDPVRLTAIPTQGIAEEAIMDDLSNQPDTARHRRGAAESEAEDIPGGDRQADSGGAPDSPPAPRLEDDHQIDNELEREECAEKVPGSGFAYGLLALLDRAAQRLDAYKGPAYALRAMLDRATKDIPKIRADADSAMKDEIAAANSREMPASEKASPNAVHQQIPECEREARSLAAPALPGSGAGAAEGLQDTVNTGVPQGPLPASPIPLRGLSPETLVQIERCQSRLRAQFLSTSNWSEFSVIGLGLAPSVLPPGRPLQLKQKLREHADAMFDCEAKYYPNDRAYEQWFLDLAKRLRIEILVDYIQIRTTPVYFGLTLDEASEFLGQTLQDRARWWIRPKAGAPTAPNFGCLPTSQAKSTDTSPAPMGNTHRVVQTEESNGPAQAPQLKMQSYFGIEDPSTRPSGQPVLPQAVNEPALQPSASDDVPRLAADIRTEPKAVDAGLTLPPPGCPQSATEGETHREPECHPTHGQTSGNEPAEKETAPNRTNSDEAHTGAKEQNNEPASPTVTADSVLTEHGNRVTEKRKRGPKSDDSSHMRVAEILVDCPQWAENLKEVCAR